MVKLPATLYKVSTKLGVPSKVSRGAQSVVLFLPVWRLSIIRIGSYIPFEETLSEA